MNDLATLFICSQLLLLLYFIISFGKGAFGSSVFSFLVDPSIMDVLKHKCFLEELLFWTIKYEFPQKMVTFLLNMLPDQDYKVHVSY